VPRKSNLQTNLEFGPKNGCTLIVSLLKNSINGNFVHNESQAFQAIENTSSGLARKDAKTTLEWVNS
jgi:hypothetical protein